MKHTQGKTVLKPGPRNLVNCVTEMIQHESRQFDICYLSSDDRANMEGNAQLINEAFNVTHTTNKTPQQLSDRVQELEKDLDEAIKESQIVAMYNSELVEGLTLANTLLQNHPSVKEYESAAVKSIRELVDKHTENS